MDIADWLRTLGLEQYEAAFHENAVDADLLPSLTAEDLKDLGITAVGHRRRLLDAIAKLRVNGALTDNLNIRAPTAGSPDDELIGPSSLSPNAVR